MSFRKKCSMFATAMLAAFLLITPVRAEEQKNENVPQAETEQKEIITPEVTVTPTPEIKAGWYKTEKGNYYWRKEDGKTLKAGGWQVLAGKRYYLTPKGRRKTGLLKIKNKRYFLDPYMKTGFRTINGKRYYFDKNTGEALTGWQEIKGKTYVFGKYGSMFKEKWTKKNGKLYYISKKGYLITGPKLYKVNGSYYFFSKEGYRLTGLQTLNGVQYCMGRDGKLIRNKANYKIGDKYYKIDSKGKIVQVNTLQTQCAVATRNFINSHSRADMSNAQKFRACFNYIIAYTNFKPWINPSAEDFRTDTWPHQAALDMLENGLGGSCYGIASLIASCAKELGYEPYVYAAWEDHAFVIIDGLYYDNMGPKFGSSYQSSFTKRSMVKF